jgi:hypothetical protein
MTALAPGLALVFAMAVLPGPPPRLELAGTSPALGVLIADLTVVPEAKPPEQNEQKVAERPERTAHDPNVTGNPPRDRPPVKPREPDPAKCYQDLLDFSLGDSDSKTNERIRNQECK